MTDINQNFSLISGDTINVDYVITPATDTPLDLTQANISWTAFPQINGVPDKTEAVITKTNAVDGGIEIIDPAAYHFEVDLVSDDTAELSGNYYYEIVIVDPAHDSARNTTTIGTMTAIDTSDPINVIAFKTLNPEFADVDDTVIQYALEQASLYIDDSWEPEVVQATFLLAGHFTAAAEVGSGTSGKEITSERIGQISVTYASSAASGDAYPGLGSTAYGLQFQALMRRSSPGIALV